MNAINWVLERPIFILIALVLPVLLAPVVRQWWRQARMRRQIEALRASGQIVPLSEGPFFGKGQFDYYRRAERERFARELVTRQGLEISHAIEIVKTFERETEAEWGSATATARIAEAE